MIGIIEAINPMAKSFDPDALLVMTGIGGLAGTTIQNAQLFEQLQAAHQRYRELFEDSIDPMLITDWEGNIVEANRQAMLLSGYSSDQLHTLPIDQFHEVNWNRTGTKFETLRENRTSSYESILQKDESQLPMEVHARRVEFDETDSIQWIMRDITERKELDSLRNDLTAMIYHDLRSPLANIVSSLDVLYSMVPENDRETVEFDPEDRRELHRPHPAPGQFPAGCQPPGIRAAGGRSEGGRYDGADPGRSSGCDAGDQRATPGAAIRPSCRAAAHLGG